MNISHFSLCLAIAITLFFPISVSAEARRVALVIGNEQYERLGALNNPVRDAKAIAAQLRSHGFEVRDYYNVRRNRLLDILEDFRRFSRGATEAVAFYAGHGMALGGRDVIAPIDLRYDCKTGDFSRAVKLQDFRQAIASVPKQVIILDACRNKPFPKCSSQSIARMAGGFRALGRLETGGEAGVFGAGGGGNDNRKNASVLVANAALLGKLASDGIPGSHSPFVRVLLARFKSSPRGMFRDLLDGVARDVRVNTQGRQVPEIRVQGGPPFMCLAGRECQARDGTLVSFPRPLTRTELAEKAYTAAKGNENKLVAMMGRYDGTIWSEYARKDIEKIRRKRNMRLENIPEPPSIEEFMKSRDQKSRLKTLGEMGGWYEK